MSPRQYHLQPMPLRRVEPSTPGVARQSSLLDAWRAHNGPEHLREHRQRGLAQAGATWGRGRRSYAGAAVGRTTADWVTLSTSADAELYTALRMLRNRSRSLARDNEHVKHALRLIVNNIIGPQGIRFQAQVKTRAGKLNAAVNARIEKEWARWCRADSCHTAGKLDWLQIQRMSVRDAAEAGDILLRKVKRAFGRSRVPFALELIEAEQLVENYSGRSPRGNIVKMGVELDDWQRPVGYWLYPRHPGDLQQTGVPQSNDYIFVPADEIIHIAAFERPSQTRGVPWGHATMTKSRHIGGTEEAEIVRARASAAIMGFVQTPEADLPTDEDDSGADDVVDGERVWDMSPGTIRELAPGETFSGFNPSTPNAALDPFLRYMHRCSAAGWGISYESYTGDYSQTNYSSGRLGKMTERDLWRSGQAWIMPLLHQAVYEAWLEMAVLSGALNLPGYESDPEVYQAVRWYPRGWAWIDPLKEVMAAKAAVRAGFTTTEDVVADQGDRDWEDVYTQLAAEREFAEELDLVVESDPAQTNDKGALQTSAPAEEGGPGTAAAAADAADDAAQGAAGESTGTTTE